MRIKITSTPEIRGCPESVRRALRGLTLQAERVQRAPPGHLMEGQDCFVVEVEEVGRALWGLKKMAEALLWETMNPPESGKRFAVLLPVTCAQLPCGSCAGCDTRSSRSPHMTPDDLTPCPSCFGCDLCPLARPSPGLPPAAGGAGGGAGGTGAASPPPVRRPAPPPSPAPEDPERGLRFTLLEFD